MKKIILTFILSSFLPAIAVAEDKTMHNSNPTPDTLMSGKHMMNSNPTPDTLMSGKHMMNSDPSGSSSKGTAGASNTKKQVNKGYTYIKYKK